MRRRRCTDVREPGRFGRSLRVLRLAAGGDGEQRAAVEAFSVEITRSLCAPKRSCAQRRASFNAASLASAPELQKNTRSANVDRTSRSASRSAGSFGEPVRDVPELARLFLQRANHRGVASGPTP